MHTQHTIFISPHLDDVTLSCGGLVWDLNRRGHRVEIWTLMAGLPLDDHYSELAQELHATWGISGVDAIRARRAEDRAACAVLGAELRHFDWLDAIYRRDPSSGEPIVKDFSNLFNSSSEADLVAEISAALTAELPQRAGLVMPMGLGGHVDHRLVVNVGKQIGGVDEYYADYPYVINHFENPLLKDGEFKYNPYHLGEDALHAWQEAVLCYKSQLSSFWRNDDETLLALRNYLAGGGGRLWRKA
ncbi:MAG: PIG-L family deacetylase [Anaerolineaceae bacterium]